MALETRIYQKENNIKFFKLLKQSLSDIYSSRFLAKQLAIRDIKAQYRQSYLGIFWAFVGPLTTAFIWMVLNSSGTVKLSDTGIPYPVYAFSGTLLWSIIVESINSPTSSTNSAKGIMSKINFPKEALIVSGIYKLLFNSSIKIVLLIVFVFFYGIGFNWSLFLFPVVILGAILFGTTFGLFLTPISMLYKDIGRAVTMGLMLVMYATPVVFAVPKEAGIMRTLMENNPLSAIILTARDMVVGTTPEYINYFILLVIISIPVFFLALLFYRISIPIIVERMSA